MKINHSIFFILLLPFLISGCVRKELDFEQPKIQIPKHQKKPMTKKGSLYSNKGGSLFADKKDLQIGDIIQVVINEELTADSDNSRDTSGTSSGSFNGIVSGPNATNITPSQRVNELSQKLNSNLGFDIGVGSSSSFSGSAQKQIDETFATTISVIIEQTYQNGNYFIKGSKQMLIDGQSQEIKVSGVIRPYDISPENSVLSSQIANLKVMYEKDGEEADALRTPWGLKILRALWPF